MTTGDRINSLRKKNNMTQENLADRLKVSRQTISKWESDVAYPETDKLIELAKLFNVSVDYILRGTEDVTSSDNNRSSRIYNSLKEFAGAFHFEYKSNKTVGNVPLVHINLGLGMYKAKGIIAVGVCSLGVVSIGLFSLGLLAIGIFALGLLALGDFALGVLAAGAIAIGVIAVGAIAVGMFSIGALSVGLFSFGALSVAQYVAIGDEAYAQIAIGMTKAVGSVYESYSGEPNTFAYVASEAKAAIDQTVPVFWGWFSSWIKAFL